MKKEEAAKKIEAGITALHEALAAGKSEELTRYLKVMSRFHRYSFGNVMLILVQRHVTCYYTSLEWLKSGVS